MYHKEMRTLYLLRHAKSAWDDPSLDDHERPLAARGTRAATAVAEWVAVHEVRPDVVLCSTAARAQATLELVLPGLGDPAVLVEPGLYGASGDQLLTRIAGLPNGIGEAMLIGHEPALSALLRLVGREGPHRRRLEQKFPTCALAILEGDRAWSGLGPGSMRIVELVLPRDL